MYIAYVSLPGFLIDNPPDEYETVREAWEALKANYFYYSKTPCSKVLIAFDIKWNHEAIGTVYGDYGITYTVEEK